MKWMLIAGAGGALGAALRSLLAARAQLYFPEQTHWSILAINSVGSLLASFLFFGLYLTLSAEWRTFLLVGALGGFTTYSSFALDVGRLITAERFVEAATYVVLTQVCVIAALFLGGWLHKLVFS